MGWAASFSYFPAHFDEVRWFLSRESVQMLLICLLFVVFWKEMNLRWSILSLNDLIVQSSSAQEPGLLVGHGAPHVPSPFSSGLLRVNAGWAHSQPDKSICWWTTYEDPCSLHGSSGKDAAPLNLPFITPVGAEHVFPGLWLKELFLFNLHVKQQTSCEHTCRGRYWHYRCECCASSHSSHRENLALWMFLLLCQIIALLRLAVFLLWLTCTVVTLSFEFSLEFKQIVMVMQRAASCTLLHNIALASSRMWNTKVTFCNM